MFYQMAAMMILVFVTGVKQIGAENILKEIKEGRNGDQKQAENPDQKNTKRSKKGLFDPFDIFDYASGIVDEATD